MIKLTQQMHAEMLRKGFIRISAPLNSFQRFTPFQSKMRVWHNGVPVRIVGKAGRRESFTLAYIEEPAPAEDTCTAKQAEAGCACRLADVWHDRFRRPKASSLRAAFYRGMARAGVGGIVDQGDALITRKRYEEMKSTACFFIDRGGHALVFTRLASTIPSVEGDGEIVAQGTDPVTNKTVYLIVID